MPTPGILGKKIRVPDARTMRTSLVGSKTPTEPFVVSAASTCVSVPAKNSFGVM